jgi:hypothetical protein
MNVPVLDGSESKERAKRILANHRCEKLKVVLARALCEALSDEPRLESTVGLALVDIAFFLMFLPDGTAVTTSNTT